MRDADKKGSRASTELEDLRKKADFSHGLCPECVENLYPEVPRRPEEA